MVGTGGASDDFPDLKAFRIDANDVFRVGTEVEVVPIDELDEWPTLLGFIATPYRLL
jgi:hypothetical protein